MRDHERCSKILKRMKHEEVRLVHDIEKLANTTPKAKVWQAMGSTAVAAIDQPSPSTAAAQPLPDEDFLSKLCIAIR